MVDCFQYSFVECNIHPSVEWNHACGIAIVSPGKWSVSEHISEITVFKSHRPQQKLGLKRNHKTIFISSRKFPNFNHVNPNALLLQHSQLLEVKYFLTFLVAEMKPPGSSSKYPLKLRDLTIYATLTFQGTKHNNTKWMFPEHPSTHSLTMKWEKREGKKRKREQNAVDW